MRAVGGGEDSGGGDDGDGGGGGGDNEGLASDGLAMAVLVVVAAMETRRR